MTTVTLQTALSKNYDVCVIGAGAAGLALALSLGQAGMKVLVIEQGGFDEGTIDPSERRDLHLSTDTHDPRHRTNREAVAGTLLGWGGRCMPFDPEDFAQARSRHKHPWSISFNDYARWIAPAAEFLKADSTFRYSSLPNGPDIPGVCLEKVELLNAQDQATNLQERLKNGLEPIDLLPRTRVLSFRWEASEKHQVRGLTLTHAGQTCVLPCKKLVLACGGLETTRMLLLEKAAHPKIFASTENALGRYYMGHLTGGMAEITFTDPQLAKQFGYQSGRGRSPYRRRFCLSNGAPSNVAFWLENLHPEDPRQSSGEISLKKLLKKPKGLEDAGNHIANVLKDPIGASNILRSAAQRFLPPSMRRPQRLALVGRGPYILAYHAEHFPEPESQVTLSEERDKFGQRMLQIDFRYGQRTIDALMAGHKLLAKRLKAANVAEITLPEDEAFAKAIEDKARDGYHQAGLTRMSATPGSGVVDSNCCVHGTDNLYVASASVFPVSGQANPTLSVVAMSLRLADHLKRHLRSEVTQ
ncbi:GMC oxidoreductase [Shimia sp. R9_3]|uniref:GMC oxidoreductase n=1 Tax=Shimia sp. R9_3 TaxID=2821113 RepID=UPI001AD961F8|nr:GMC oxidoreductase [Shimia sp. R9_3]MBO9403197.1 GMC family oxidoreductase [Shimia sp. R9_3]